MDDLHKNRVLRHFRCKQTVSNAYPIKIIHAFLISHLLNLKKVYKTPEMRGLQSIGIYYGFPLGISFVY